MTKTRVCSSFQVTRKQLTNHHIELSERYGEVISRLKTVRVIAHTLMKISRPERDFIDFNQKTACNDGSGCYREHTSYQSGSIYFDISLKDLYAILTSSLVPRIEEKRFCRKKWSDGIVSSLDHFLRQNHF